MTVPSDILVTPLLLSVDENSATGTVIGTLNVVDVDMTSYTWSLVDNAGGRFGISGARIVVANGALLDYERQSSYSIIVRVTEAGLTRDEEFTITLNDVKGEIVNGSAGVDTILADVGNDSLVGGAGNDSLSGGAGNDNLSGNAGADTMSGGAGNDTFYVDNVLDLAIDDAFFGGTDLVISTVAYTLSGNIENLTLLGTAVSAIGNSLANVLIGNAGGNILNGMVGIDTMAGGLGDDTYYVDNSNDVVQELMSEGTDTIIASVSYNLTVAGSTAPREVEKLTLAAGATNINATGNGLANTLTGNDGNNILNGMAGADTMIGGLGNDTYYVDGAADVITESSATGGTDTVVSSSTYSIAAIANVENITLTGTAAANATGNALANLITGNSAANLIDGGAGNDTMAGGQGNDTYVLSAATDVVTEGLNAGTDTIRIAATFSIGAIANVERLELLGTGNFGATGNTLNNQLVGNAGANALDGGTGMDTMAGGAGNDTYTIDSTFDIVSEGASAGTDTVIAKASFVLGANIENLTMSGTAVLGIANAQANVVIGNATANGLDGGAGNDTIDGGAGNDTISGGAGLDSLTGGLGADYFYFDTAPNTTTNVDTIIDFTAGSDSIRLAKSIFAAAGPVGALSASAFAAGTAAMSASSRIIYDIATGNLFYDADGTGSAAAVKVAVIANKAALTAKDFAVTLSAPTATLINDTGASTTDKITNDGTVKIGGLVSGGKWQYSVNGGTTWLAGTGTSVTLTGDGMKSIVVRQLDASSNLSARSAPLIFMIDTLAPSEAVASLALSADTGTSATDFVTRTAAQTLTGTLSGALFAGNMVKVSLDNGATWQTATAAVGTNTFSLGGITLSGTNTILARVEDSTGHVNSTVAQAYTLDTVAPTATVSSVSISDDTGRSASDFITNASTQTVSGTLSAPLGTGDIVRISIDNGGTWQTATTAVGSASYTLRGVVLASSGTMIVRVEDAAGNLGASRSQAYTLDLVAPAERVSTLAFSVDNGPSATDFVTNADSQTITGALNAPLQPGNIVRISMDNGVTWQTATATAGTTTFTLTGVVLELGTHVMIARVEDAAGNASIAKLQSYTLEPPEPSEFVVSVAFSADTGTSANDFVTRIPTQTITGSLSAPLETGNVVKISLDGGLSWLAATSAPGSTTFALGGVTLSGSATMIARVEDSAGRPSAARSVVYSIDTTAPLATPASISFTGDTGISGSDLITSTATQTIWGTLAAPLIAGDIVRVSLDAGATWQIASAPSGGSTYSLAGVTLTGENIIVVRVDDAAGNISDTLAQAFMIDTTAPTERVVSVAFSDDTGASGTDLITNAEEQTITGTLSGPLVGGSLVRVSIDNGASWVTADANEGDTTFALSGVTLFGSGTMLVRVEDLAGNASAILSRSYSLDETADAPGLTLAADSGVSASDKITKTGTLNVSGLEPGATWEYSEDDGSTWTAGAGSSLTLSTDGAKSVIVRQTDAAGNTSYGSAPLDFTLDTTASAPALALAADTGVSATDKVTSNGTVDVSDLEPGATWQYSANGGASWITGSGTSFTLTGDGAKSVVVRQTDVAGNTSAVSAPFDFVIDTGVSTPLLTLASDTGTSATDKVSKLGTVNVAGLEAGATWEYSTNGGATWIVGAGASFTLTGDGAKSVIVRQTDASGNVSSNTPALDFTLDTAASAPSVVLAADTGASTSDGITNMATINVSGLEAGATWQYSTDAGATWTAGSGTSVGLTGDGAKSVVVRQSDAAGNTSADSTVLNLTLDTSVAAPVVSLASDTGASGADKITKIGTVNVAGLEAGATWEYSTNGGASWSAGTGSSFTLNGDGAKSVVVRQTDVAGNTSGSSAALAFTLDTTLALPALGLVSDTGLSASDRYTNSGAFNVAGLEAGATWQFSTDGGSTWTAGAGSGFVVTGDGAKSVVVQQTDTAGNSQTSATFSMTLDTVAPGEAVSSLALSADNGVSSSDFITNVAAQTISGTLSAPLAAGNIVRVSLDNGATWQTATSMVGSTTFSLAATLPASGTLVARVEDAAGNVSTALTQVYNIDSAVAAPSLSLVSDTGGSGSDNVTKTGSVSVAGLEPGASWQYSTDSGASWTAGSGTAFTLTGDGSKSVIVRQIDIAGNTSANSAALVFTLDTAAPVAPALSLSSDTGSSASDQITTSGVVSVSGLEAGASWQYSTDSGTTWTAGSGTSFVLTGDGPKTAFVRQTDVAGNTSGNSSMLSFILDTTAPSGPTLALATDSGSSASDNVTITGVVNVSGLEPGASWQYSLDGVTWTAGTGASFTVSGDGAKTVSVKQIDTAGNFSAASTLVFTLDTTAPTAPVLGLASDTGASGADNVTSSGVVTVTGLEPGASWQYSLDGTTWTAGTGTSFAVTGDGGRSVTVMQTDIAGNVSAASAAFAFTLDTVAPSAPIIALAVDSGTSGSDKITALGLVNISGLESGATWQYSLDGVTWTAGTGTSFVVTGDGAKSVSVRQIDVAGNMSVASSVLAFTLDTVTAVPLLSLTSDTGSSSFDSVTNAGTVSVSGLEAGASWQYSTDGGGTWTAGSGTSFTLTGDGSKSVIVRQSDIAGNTSANSAALDFTLDTAAPVAPALALESDTGNSASDQITNAGVVSVSGLEAGATWQYSTDSGATWMAGSGTSFTLSGDGPKTVVVRQTDVAGNTSGSSSMLSFILDTTAPSGPTLALATDSGNSASDNVTTAGVVNVSGLEPGASWQYSLDGVTWTAGTGASFTLTGDGAKTVRVTQIDTAGNISSASVLAFTLDTAAPSAPVVVLASDTGSSSSDNLTNAGVLNVTGLEIDAAWQYSLDGTTWTAGSGTSFTVSGDGAKSVSVRQIDVAGNVSAPSATYNFTLDTAAPAAPAIALAADTGSSGSDKVTSSGLVNVTGLEAGATWQYSLDGTTWTAGTGTSFTVAGDGAKSVSVRQIDVAGNVSAVSAALAFTFDTAVAAPTLSLFSDTGSSGSDGITKTGTVSVGGLEPGATWQYSLDGMTWTTGSGSALSLSGNATRNLIVRQTDAAGNLSANSATLTYTLDTAAPTAPTLALASDTGSSATDKITNTGTVNISGLEAGATWEYSLNGTTWTAGSGSSLTLAGDTTRNLQVRQTDVAGNVSASSVTYTYTIDTTAASAPVLALASDTGSSATDKISKTGTVNVTGLEAAATWQYSLDGTTWTAGTGTSLTLSGDATRNLIVRQMDVAGNVSASSAAFIYTLDTTAPAALTAALASDTGSSATDKKTQTGTVSISGLEAGATWQYSLDTTTWTAGTGTSVTLSGDGVKSIIVRQTDVAGNTSSNSATLAFTLDATAPSAPALALASDTGSSTTDKLTKTGTVNITGLEAGATWSYSLDGTTWTAGSGTTLALTGDGTRDLIVRQTDAAGNESANSATLTYILDTTVPTAPTLALASDTGSSATDKITKVGTVNISGLEAGATWQYSLDGTTWTAGTGTTLALTGNATRNLIVRQTDAAGNVSVNSSTLTYTLDTAVPTVNAVTSNGTTTTLNEILTFKFNGQVSGFTAADLSFTSISAGTVVATGVSLVSYSGGIETYSVNITKNTANSTFKVNLLAGTITDLAGNANALYTSALLRPAGVAGSPINLGLETLADEGLSYVILKVPDLPADWRIDGGARLSDGSWQISADKLAEATVLSPSSFLGAAVVDMVVEATYADGHTAMHAIGNNIETYAAGNPIFAWAGDDNLTGSAGADTFVVADPIGSVVIYDFDAAADVVDLVAFDGFGSFADVLAHLGDDTSGSAVLTLGDGQTIRFAGVRSADLDGGNFQFDVEATVENAGVVEILDGAMLPLAGNVHNTGTIRLLGSEHGAHLQVVQQGATLSGNGHVVLSDDADNVIWGTGASNTLTNAGNTISGAGRIGGFGLAIVNEGTIVADGVQALLIDASAGTFVNRGLAEATGTAGLTVGGALDNDGTVWANGSSVTVQGEASGDGRYLVSGHGIIAFEASASGRIEIAEDASATVHFSARGFDGAISGFDGDDRIVLDGDWSGAALAVTGTATGALLTIGAGGATETLALTGHYDVAGFSLLADGNDHVALIYTRPAVHAADCVVG